MKTLKQKNFFPFLQFIAKSKVGNQNKKASVMYLSHKQTSKDLQLKTQMAVSIQDEDLKNTEKIWVESGFFKDCQSDLTISKANFPELTFCYVNKGQVSLVKGSQQAVYLRSNYADR